VQRKGERLVVIVQERDTSTTRITDSESIYRDGCGRVDGR
jgi:hypothetical protein